MVAKAAAQVFWQLLQLAGFTCAHTAAAGASAGCLNAFSMLYLILI
jgi:hypothetical protein